MKKILLTLGLILLIGSITYAITFDVTLDNGFGTYKQGEHPSSDTTINISKGWNLLPISLISNAYGRYNGLEGQNRCSMNTIGQNIYYHSPLQNKYLKIEAMDDYSWPDERNNVGLQNEFKAQHYSIWGGSAWVYSKTDCIVKSDVGGGVSSAYGSPGSTKYYNTNGLTLKSGWNFVSINASMTYYERTLAEIFDGCGAVKFNMWDAKAQNWKYNPTKIFDTSDSVVTTPLDESQIFSTIVIKTTQDCQIMENVATGGSSSSPPTLPN